MIYVIALSLFIAMIWTFYEWSRTTIIYEEIKNMPDNSDVELIVFGSKAVLVFILLQIILIIYDSVKQTDYSILKILGS